MIFILIGLFLLLLGAWAPALALAVALGGTVALGARFTLQPCSPASSCASPQPAALQPELAARTLGAKIPKLQPLPRQNHAPVLCADLADTCAFPHALTGTLLILTPLFSTGSPNESHACTLPITLAVVLALLSQLRMFAGGPP